MAISFVDKYLMRFFLLILIILGYGCSSQTRHFYSPDNSKCITIITDGETRYIMNGEHDDLPDSNYVKISLKKIDRETGDQVVGCWDRGNLEWIILMNKAIVIENRLDSSKFLFRQNFPRRGLGIPTLESYHSALPNCFSIDFEYNKVANVDGAIVKE